MKTSMTLNALPNGETHRMTNSRVKNIYFFVTLIKIGLE